MKEKKSFGSPIALSIRRDVNIDLFQVIKTGYYQKVDEYILFAKERELKGGEKFIIDRTRWSGFTALHIAASLGYTDICELLLDNGANINARTTRGYYNVLHLCIGNGFFDTATVLIDRGADTNAKTKVGDDPFDFGIKNGFREYTIDFKQKVRMKEYRSSMMQMNKISTSDKVS